MSILARAKIKEVFTVPARAPNKPGAMLVAVQIEEKICNTGVLKTGLGNCLYDGLEISDGLISTRTRRECVYPQSSSACLYRNADGDGALEKSMLYRAQHLTWAQSLRSHSWHCSFVALLNQYRTKCGGHTVSPHVGVARSPVCPHFAPLPIWSVTNLLRDPGGHTAVNSIAKGLLHLHQKRLYSSTTRGKVDVT